MDTMIDAGPWFVAFFVVLLIARLVFAHLVYAWIVSRAPECPCCNADTYRIQRKNVAWLFPNLRPSWCPDCGWEGMLQFGPESGGNIAAAAEAPALADAEQRPTPRERAVEPVA